MKSTMYQILMLWLSRYNITSQDKDWTWCHYEISANIRHWWRVANYPKNGQINGKSNNSSQWHQSLAHSAHYYYITSVTTDNDKPLFNHYRTLTNMPTNSS